MQGIKGKGLVDDWVVRQSTDDIQTLGYTDLRIKADNETPITAVMNKVKEFRDLKSAGKTIPDPSVAGQPQTNGVAEKAVQDVTVQVRKLSLIHI